MSNAILEVKNLKKYFNTPGGVLHAVDDVSFTLEKGKILGVVGESGCGKSTICLLYTSSPRYVSRIFRFSAKKPEYLNKNSQNRLNTIPAASHFFRFSFFLRRPRTVSYTHLDVYKRQCEGHLHPDHGEVWF